MRKFSPLDPRTWGRDAALAALVIAATAAGADGQDIARQGTYNGRWDVAGKAQKIELGENRTVTVVKFHGAVVLSPEDYGWPLTLSPGATCFGLATRSLIRVRDGQ